MSIDIKILQSACCGPSVPVKEEIEAAAASIGVKVSIEQPTDLQEIMKYGTMTFPSIVVNGQVYEFERVRNPKALANLLSDQEVDQV